MINVDFDFVKRSIGRLNCSHSYFFYFDDSDQLHQVIPYDDGIFDFDYSLDELLCFLLDSYLFTDHLLKQLLNREVA